MSKQEESKRINKLWIKNPNSGWNRSYREGLAEGFHNGAEWERNKTSKGMRQKTKQAK